MGKSTTELRKLWKEFECAPEKMVRVPFGPDVIRVAPPTADAWKALAAVLGAHNYLIRIADSDSYNCRTITGGTGKSLHSYGIALDVNWTTNPYKDHSGSRPVLFSTKQTQEARAVDVKQHLADTDMTPDMVDAVRRITTVSGQRVFEWGATGRLLRTACTSRLISGQKISLSGLTGLRSRLSRRHRLPYKH